MSKILCIPDVHGRKFWRKAIADNISEVDKVIFLGDYLDPYGEEFDKDPTSMECDSFYDYKSLLKMLNDIISLKRNEPDKYILLCGNHTCSYIWRTFNSASRTDNVNWKYYHDFFKDNLELFQLVYQCDDVIFSHAGITDGWTQDCCKYLKLGELTISQLIDKLSLDYDNKKLVELLNQISYYRGGDYRYGSCEWADIREHINDFTHHEDCVGYIPKPYPGIYQVFGHTQMLKALINEYWACLDCRKGFIIDTLTHEITECSLQQK